MIVRHYDPIEFRELMIRLSPIYLLWVENSFSKKEELISKS
jgi:hypothetical protein